MENMLQNFYNLCGGDYICAIVLNNLYYEARRNVRNGSYTTVVDLVELKDRIGLPFCDEGYLVNAVFIPIEEGMDRNGELLLEYDFDAMSRRSQFECIIHLDEIDNRLEACIDERLTVERNNKRAEALGHPATLTLAQWIYILNLWHWDCAYCGGDYCNVECGQPYEVLEHIVPLTFSDSGTTKLNCVPSCRRCNSLKGPYHPDRMPNHIRRKIGERIDGVRRFLRFINGDDN